ncbi:hypothetical protein B0H14DRAFT_2648303 [Mycena olivaceomarginata]|nr:hypothetical protein B0H14DRAFT_2648303 [Mycena olivaceomarginata]
MVWKAGAPRFLSEIAEAWLLLWGCVGNLSRAEQVQAVRRGALSSTGAETHALWGGASASGQKKRIGINGRGKSRAVGQSQCRRSEGAHWHRWAQKLTRCGAEGAQAVRRGALASMGAETHELWGGGSASGQNERSGIDGRGNSRTVGRRERKRSERAHWHQWARKLTTCGAEGAQAVRRGALAPMGAHLLWGGGSASGQKERTGINGGGGSASGQKERTGINGKLTFCGAEGVQGSQQIKYSDVPLDPPVLWRGCPRTQTNWARGIQDRLSPVSSPPLENAYFEHHACTYSLSEPLRHDEGAVLKNYAVVSSLDMDSPDHWGRTGICLEDLV